MLTHINRICLHISGKCCTFVVEKERETNLSQTQNLKRNMITLQNLNERGIAYIAMAIQDIIYNEGHDAEKGHGVYLSHTWLTPNTCYWLLELLKAAGPVYSNQEVRDMLQAGTNVGLK